MVIPSWNGRTLLERHLPSVLAACRLFPGPSEIVVADDGSDDKTEAFIRQSFPSVRCVALPRQPGYGRVCNEGIRQARFPIVFLLNNDVLVKRSCLIWIPSHFDDPDVFAVKIRSLDFIGRSLAPGFVWTWKEPLWTRGEFFRGMIENPARACPPASSSPHGRYAFSVSSGAFAMDRRKFLELGGFDDLFLPFYSEETDLAYRAWKVGWKIVYETRSRVYHLKSQTIGALDPSRVQTIGERNRYLLVWANITDSRYLISHFLWTAARLFWNAFRGRWPLVHALREALPKWGEARRKARERAQASKLTDRELFNFFRLES